MNARSVVNLTMHGIGPPTRELDPGEREVWISVEEFEQLLDAIAGRSDVQLTFDDGNLSDVEIALPMLLERGLCARFFVLAGRLGELGRLDRGHVRALADAGMSIGSHGWAHRDWRGIDSHHAVVEFEAAPRLLSELVDHPVSDVAVPFGSYDRTVLRRLRAADVRRVYTSDGGRVRPDRWLQGRTSLRAGCDLDSIRALILRGERPVPRARRKVITWMKRTRSAGLVRRQPGPPVRGNDRPVPAEYRSMAPRRTTIGVVIVTYNSAEQLPGCLEALSAGCDGVRLSEVVVADNASSDRSPDVALQSTKLPVSVVQMGENLGYAAAINAAIEALNCDDLDAVLVLNPDITIRPGAVAALAGALRRPACGISVPKLVNPDGTLQPSLRRPPTLPRAMVEALVGGHRAGRLGETITESGQYEQSRTVSWATGAAMLISTDVVRDVGRWDESFLLYSEETDYALRAGDRGWQLWYEPSAVMEHVSGDAFKTNPTMSALVAVNRVRVYRKRHGALASAAYHAVVTFGAALRAATGRRTARAEVTALVRPSRRLQALPG